MNNFLLTFFAVLSILCFLGGCYADGVCIWLSFLTLSIWPILAGNLLLLPIQLFTKKKWKSIVPLLAVLLHAEYLSAVYQPPYWNRPAAVPQEGTPLTVVTYNASHFYWNKKYTMNEAAAYIKKQQPDIICFQEAPDNGYYHPDSIRQAFAYAPYRSISRRTDHSPVAIYSRYPIHQVKTAITAPGKTLKVRVKAAKDLILKMKDNYRKRADQADSIHAEIERSPYPVLVCGDFNDTPASYTYRQIRKGLTDGFRDCGSGYQYTFRQLYKLWRIDYVFYSKPLKGHEYYSPEKSYSDHNMVVWKGIMI